MIKNKKTDRTDPEAMKMLRGVLINFGEGGVQRGLTSYGAYLKRISEMSNAVALAFIRAGGSSAVDY